MKWTNFKLVFSSRKRKKNQTMLLCLTTVTIIRNEISVVSSIPLRISCIEITSWFQIISFIFHVCVSLHDANNNGQSFIVAINSKINLVVNNIASRDNQSSYFNSKNDLDDQMLSACWVVRIDPRTKQMHLLDELNTLDK